MHDHDRTIGSGQECRDGYSVSGATHGSPLTDPRRMRASWMACPRPRVGLPLFGVIGVLDRDSSWRLSCDGPRPTTSHHMEHCHCRGSIVPGPGSSVIGVYRGSGLQSVHSPVAPCGACYTSRRRSGGQAPGFQAFRHSGYLWSLKSTSPRGATPAPLRPRHVGPCNAFRPTHEPGRRIRLGPYRLFVMQPYQSSNRVRDGQSPNLNLIWRDAAISHVI